MIRAITRNLETLRKRRESTCCAGYGLCPSFVAGWSLCSPSNDRTADTGFNNFRIAGLLVYPFSLVLFISSRGQMDEIGKHCGSPLCNQLDFLPFFCQKCQNFYCLQHRTQTDHDCPAARWSGLAEPTTVGCKRCRRLLEVPDSVTADAFLAAHMQTTECDEAQRERPRCSLSSCKSQKTSCLVQCKECLELFCISHRFPADHQCTVTAAAEASRAARIEASAALVAQARERLKARQTSVASEVTVGSGDPGGCRRNGTGAAEGRGVEANNAGHRFVQKSNMTAKGSQTMRKVEAMKIRARAKADPSIRDSNRLAVRVDWHLAPREKLPAPLREEGRVKDGMALLLDGSKSVGWNLDLVCSRLSIRNANAQTGPDATSWALGIYDTNEENPGVVAVTLEAGALMRDCLQDGSVLLLLWENSECPDV